MGKLFDRTDHIWEMAQIDRAEQEASNNLTGLQLVQLEGVGRSDKLRLERSKTGAAVGYFEKLRRASRMKLLKTGQLMSDLRVAMALFKACPYCSETQGKLRICQVHKKQVNGAMMAVKWAGEENMATRLAQPGRVWGDEEPTSQAERGLNHWEQWYYNDKKEGVWPGTLAYTGSQQDVDNLRKEYGSLDYRGWLQFIFEEEEIPYEEFLREKARLSA